MIMSEGSNPAPEHGVAREVRRIKSRTTKYDPDTPQGEETYHRWSKKHYGHNVIKAGLHVWQCVTCQAYLEEVV